MDVGGKSRYVIYKRFIMIIYIGFSTKTYKTLARIVCRRFKHCAPVVVTKNKCKIYQFTKTNKITIINVKKRDIKILEQFGWKFVKYSANSLPQNALNIRAITCVQFTKRFCGIEKITLQTPDALLKYLIQK